MAMYVNDLCTRPASLAGSPAISVPNGLAGDDGPPLPTGLQIMGPAMRDDLCYRVAAAFEAAHGPVLTAATTSPAAEGER
jgi:aspartyl-tRNA(Asn)/glutamyl-tRNA(Gln) amidotransferase subunit A